MKLTGVSLALGLAVFSISPASASFEAGQAALDRSDAVTAVDEWIAVAKRGDSRAQFALGQLLEKGGDGVVADPVDALSWYRLAAAQGLTEASEAAERLSGQLGAAEVEEAHLRTLATVGVWFRTYTGQDEAAYQQMRAVAAAERPSSARVEIGTPETSVADQRAAAQREMIEQRKAQEEAEARTLEESRQAAIAAAQQQAEEAKRQAALRDQQIAVRRQAIAEQTAAPAVDEQEAARARLAALMAKQGDSAGSTGAAAAASAPPVSNAPASAPTVAASPSANGSITKETVPAPVAETGSAAKATESPAAKLEETPTATPASTDKLKESKSQTMPEAGSGGLAPSPQKTPSQQMASTQGDTSSQPSSPLTDEKSASLAALQSYDGLDRNVVEEIFEQAKIADLGTPAAQREIENSISRIEALKWSLISGAKGDKAAPKMNKVLMSKMSPVQIAEANRLASEWLIAQQRNL
ncbi:MAG: hypothetical protein CMN55_14920 [Sneathiella sp.]|uniref:hypothetical protein n=1 Tax=Sneathiella sp. TaxID=1964365 RepID=UPI000C5F0CFA|nr:hypothetical protein [Sneathiella sp.]MAL80376.1 hypothetical protein [Sneathiella sp.]